MSKRNRKKSKSSRIPTPGETAISLWNRWKSKFRVWVTSSLCGDSVHTLPASVNTAPFIMLVIGNLYSALNSSLISPNRSRLSLGSK